MTDCLSNDEQHQPLIQMLPLSSTDSVNKISLEITKSELVSSTIVRSFRWPKFSNRSLRVTFLTFIGFIGLTSFTSALIIGSTFVQFKQQCPLYATFQFEILNTDENNRTVRINLLSENFSSQSICDFCTFYNVFTFIYCVMSGFFFVLFNGDHRIVTKNDQCLIVPCFPISTALGVLSLINASIITNGFLKFCSTITSNNPSILSCTDLNQLAFEQYPNVSRFFVYILTTIIASWFQSVCFIGVIGILTIRLGSSFDWRSSSPKINVEKTRK